MLGSEARRRRTSGAEPGLDLDERAAASWERANIGESAGSDEERSQKALVSGRREDAQLSGAQTLQLHEVADDLFERRDPVAQSGGVLITQTVGKVAQAAAEARKRSAEQKSVEFNGRRAFERSRCELRAAPASDRAPNRRGRRHDDAFSVQAEVDVAIGARASRVRGRPERMDQTQLLDGRFELRAELAPFDSLERCECSLDGRPLALGAEVGTQAGTQVAGLADVEDLIAGPAEEVDPRTRGRAVGEVSLPVDAAAARRGKLAQISNRSRAAFLREPDEGDEDLRGRLRVG